MYHNISKVIAIIIVIQFVSCDILTTRDAEDPEIGRSSFVIANTPEQLFVNIINSFSEKIEKDYINNFADTSFIDIEYKFLPSSEAVFKYNILSEWNLETELAYFRNLTNVINKNEKVRLELEFLFNSVEGDGENHSYDYTITLPPIDESINLIYKGNAFFRIRLDQNNQWVITEWIDTKTSNEPTWSELKGRFYLF